MTRPEQILDPDALRRYERDGMDALSPGEQLLMRMRWYGWISAGELMDSMDLDDPKVRWTYAGALYYRVRCGDVEARGTGVHREYRLARRAA